MNRNVTPSLMLSVDEARALIDEALATQAASHAAAMSVLDAEVADLRAAVQSMELRDTGPYVYEPLKRAAGMAGVDYESARRWCVDGDVIARKTKGRWAADPKSLATHAALTRR